MDIAIPVGFLILAVILLWFFINTKGRLVIKVCLTLLAGYYSLVTWRSLDSYEGWPTDEKMPEEFLLHWVVIKEPDKKTSDKGALFVWITSPEVKARNVLNFLGRQSTEEPRIYRLPYSLKMHEKLEKARGVLMKGKVVRGKKGGKDGQGQGGDGTRNGNGRGSSSTEQEYEFHELLPTKLPEKR